MVTGLLRKHVFVRRQFWTGFWPISNGEGFKIGLRLAFGRPETDFEVFPIRNRPKSGPTLHSLLQPDLLKRSGHNNRQQCYADDDAQSIHKSSKTYPYPRELAVPEIVDFGGPPPTAKPNGKLSGAWAGLGTSCHL
jgi:hypothetical protein